MVHPQLSIAGLGRLSQRELARVSALLRGEFASGIAVMVAAFLGFIAANSPLSPAYTALRDLRIGPAALHLDLTVGAWAADGLLAVFFFMVGLELKREFVGGALSRFNTAIVPVAAAFGGVAVPALCYLAFTAATDASRGWAIPTATDIAFAVAVLGLLAPRIPPALRVFLLTLAVVDDLIAIAVIAVFYTNGVQFWALGAALVPLALYALLAHRFASWFTRRRWAAWAVLLPLGGTVWALVHASGVHATIAGVALAFAVPVTAVSRGGTGAQAPDLASGSPVSPSGTASQGPSGGRKGTGAAAAIDLAEVFGHRFGPLSSGFAVPVFAFFAAGVAVSGGSRFPFDPIAFGILVGLVLGKPVGIALTTWLLTRFSRAELGGEVSLRELIGVACLGGIGFTVSLLIADLSFADAADADTARLAVMAGSLLATGVAAAFLVRRPRGRSRRGG